MTLILIYIFYALYFFKGRVDEFLYFILNIPAISWIFCFATFLICFLIGLPIRLNNTVNNRHKNDQRDYNAQGAKRDVERSNDRNVLIHFLTFSRNPPTNR